MENRGRPYIPKIRDNFNLNPFYSLEKLEEIRGGFSNNQSSPPGRDNESMSNGDSEKTIQYPIPLDEQIKTVSDEREDAECNYTYNEYFLARIRLLETHIMDYFEFIFKETGEEKYFDYMKEIKNYEFCEDMTHNCMICDFMRQLIISGDEEKIYKASVRILEPMYKYCREEEV